MAHPSGTLFVPFPLQNSKSLILRHAARVGNNRHRVFVLLCTRCLKPCLRGVRLQPLAQPSSKRKEAQGENALCLHAEVSVSDKCRGRLERRFRYDRNMFFVVSRKATLYIELTLIYISNERLFDEITLNHHRISVVLQGHFRATDKPLFLYLKSGESLTAT